MKTVFCTHVDDHIRELIGANKLLASAKHFYPNIEFKVYGTEDIQRVFRDNSPWCDFYTVHPVIAHEVMVETKADMVIHIDADSMLCDTLDEIFEADFDVAAPRNSNERCKFTEHLKGIGQDKYVNAGLVAVTDIKFYEEWIKNNKEVGHSFPMKEQDVLNLLFYSGQYKNKLLDPVDSDRYYGVASIFSEYKRGLPESVKPYNYNHWESWLDIKVDKDGIYLDNKKIKVLHQAGGFNGVTYKKLQMDLFNKETQEFINGIIGNI